MKTFYKVLVGLTLAASVVFLALPAASVFAQDEEPPLAELEEQTGQGIASLFEEEIERYEKVGEAIEKSTEVVEKLEDRIAKMVENGKDASGLEEILAVFQANLAEVEDAYAEVGDLIDEHAGFDADGNVIDESLAVYTLRQIADGLLDVHQFGEDARFELKWDLMEYRYGLRNAD